jgi:hypothetical protein
MISLCNSSFATVRGSFFNFAFELIPCLPQLGLALAQAIFVVAVGTPQQLPAEKGGRGRNITNAKFKSEERFGEKKLIDNIDSKTASNPGPVPPNHVASSTAGKKRETRTPNSCSGNVTAVQIATDKIERPYR